MRRLKWLTHVIENLPNASALVMELTSRTSPPHVEHANGNPSPTWSNSFAQAIRDVS